MKKINIDIKDISKHYPIFIGENILEKINELIDLNQYSRIAIVTDKNIEKLFFNSLKNALRKDTYPIIISPGEKEKNIETVKYIWSKMLEAKLDRKSLVINLGGGVIGDIGGFAASTYMRGLVFLQIPTTLLSQVDASVGGKVGINFNEIKNLIGSFQQPVGIIIDIHSLQTLPEREYIEGFGEIIKHGLIKNKKYFAFATSKKPKYFRNKELIEIIAGSIAIKKAIIEQDEKESGTRKLLNFGHTIGHAVEALCLETNKPLLHGEAIHIGMIAETKISELTGLLSKKEAEIIYRKLSETGLPISVKNIQIEDIIEKIKSDKKNNYGEINWTLLKEIGEAVYNQKVNNNMVINALKNIIS